MAERRTLWHKISLSEQVDELAPWAQLLYTWSIAHTDDIGVLPRQAKVLRGKVFPLKDQLSTAQIESLIETIVKSGLYIEVEVGGKSYLYIKNFGKHQSLRKDRHPQISFDYPLKPYTGEKRRDRAIVKENWDLLEALVVTWQSDDSHVTTEVKGSEVKRSEEKRREPASPKAPPLPSKKKKKVEVAEKKPFGEFKNVYLTDDERMTLKEMYGVSLAKTYLENLSLYLETKKTSYRSHYHVLRTWLRRDRMPVQTKKEADTTIVSEEPLTEAQEAKIEEMRKKIRAIAYGKNINKEKLTASGNDHG